MELNLFPATSGTSRSSSSPPHETTGIDNIAADNNATVLKINFFTFKLDWFLI
ncbi:MAG: hypothetical protein K2G47_04870 [Muribaculum sp.]|nr:hypothetical protein [Muribaculum sp.]